MLFSTRHAALFSIAVLLGLAKLSSALATISPDCEPWLADMSTALKEAIDIANFAQTRWQGLANTQGTILQDMLGAGAENDANALTEAAGEPRFPSPPSLTSSLKAYLNHSLQAGLVKPRPQRTPPMSSSIARTHSYHFHFQVVLGAMARGTEY